MALLPWGSPPPSRTNIYSPADYVVSPRGSGHKADFYTDGVNDQVEINAALVAAAALPNGGTVELTTGVYQISAKVVPLSNVWLRGWGMFSTVLAATSTLNRGILDNKDEYNTGNPYVNGIISDLQLDGTNMDPAREIKGFNSDSCNNCKFMRIYAHDTNATGLGADDFYGSTLTECIVMNCGYMNVKTLTDATWSTNEIEFESAGHGYSVNDVIIVSGMEPLAYNGRYVIDSVTTDTFVVTSNFLDIDPGTATTFGISSDSLIGHNGIGIASGANTHEANIVTNNVCIGNQNNNFLIEADTTFTDKDASYIFANNYSAHAGQCGYLNTGTLNTQFINNYDFGSVFGCQVAPVTQVRTISAAVWSAGTVTFTLASAFTTNINVGDAIDINGMTPDGYNGYYKITAVTSNSEFEVALASDPGTATVFGTATRIAHDTDDTLIENNIFTDNVLYGIRVVARAERVKISGNTVKRSYNYGVAIGASHCSVTDNFIYKNGRDGLDIETGNGTHTPLNNTIVTDNHIYNNGQRATYDGIEIQSANANAPISDMIITGNRIYDDQTIKTQRYGIIVRSGGLLSNFLISNNDVDGNDTAGMLLQNTAETISVFNNPGFNPNWYHDLGNITGATTFDRLDGVFQQAVLTGNVTASVTSGESIGDMLVLELTQDGTGSRTITWPVNVDLGYGGTLVLSTTPASVDVITFIWDGTNWQEVSRDMRRQVSVAEGGSGRGTMTAYAVLAGGTTATGALQQVSGVGTSGQVLTSNGAAALPTWQAPSKIVDLVSTAVNYPMTNANDVVTVTVSAKIVTLHDSTTATVKPYTIQNASNGDISFATTSSQTVNGSTTGTIVPNQSITVLPSAGNWIII